MSIGFKDVSKYYKIRLQNGLKGFFKSDFKEIQAISGLSFNISPGKITGLIGENGAGKSTTIKLLTGILSTSNGQVETLGLNPFEKRKDLMKQIGVIFGQRSLLRPIIPVKYTFEWLRDIYGVPHDIYSKRVEILSKLFEVEDLMDRPPRELSLGQRRKCDLLAALLHGPELLLLDEPTIGLDFKAKIIFRNLLLSYSRTNNITVLISSHDLNELENLCDEFLILSGGKLKFHGTFNQLKQEFDIKNYLEVKVEEKLNKNPDEEIKKIASHIIHTASSIQIFYDESVEQIIKLIYENYIVTDLKIVKNSLQQALSVS